MFFFRKGFCFCEKCVPAESRRHHQKRNYGRHSFPSHHPGPLKKFFLIKPINYLIHLI